MSDLDAKASGGSKYAHYVLLLILSFGAAINSNAQLWRTLRDSATALQESEEKVALFKRALGALPPDSARSYTAADLQFLTATSLRLSKQYQPAVAYYQLAREGFVRFSGLGSIDYAVACNDLGVNFLLMKKYSESETQLKDAQRVFDSLVGKSDPFYLVNADNLETLYRQTGKGHLSLLLYQSIERDLAASNPFKSEQYSKIVNKLAALYTEAGDQPAALSLFNEADGVWHRHGDTLHGAYTSFLRDWANTNRKSRHFKEAIAIYQKASRIRLFLQDSIPWTEDLYSAFSLLDSLDNEHQPLQFQIASDLLFKMPSKHPKFLHVLNEIGSFFYRIGDYGMAENAYLKVLRSVLINFGTAHPNYGRALLNLAICYEKKKEWKESEKNFREAIEIFKADRDKLYELYTQSCIALANLQVAQGNGTESLASLQEAKTAIETYYGIQDPQYKVVVDKLRTLAYQLGDKSLEEQLATETLGMAKTEHSLRRNTPWLMVPVGHTAKVGSLSFSPDATKVASASDDQTVKIWDLSSGRMLLDLPVGSAVTGIDFSPDGQSFATASADGVCRIWDLQTGQPLTFFRGHTAAATDVRFSPDGNALATASDDYHVKLWTVKTGRPQMFLDVHRASVNRVGYSPDGVKLVTVSDSDTLMVVDLKKAATKYAVPGDSYYMDASFSPDGTVIGAALLSGKVQIIHAASGKILQTWAAHKQPVRQLCFLPGTNEVLTGSDDGAVKLWDRTTGRHLKTVADKTIGVTSLRYNVKNARLAIGYENGIIDYVDLNGEKLLSLQGTSSLTNDGVYTSDGAYIVTSSADQVISLWDPRSGKLMENLFDTSHSNIEKGDRRKSGFLDKNGKIVINTRRYATGTVAVAVSPAASRLVTLSATGDITLWNLKNREIIKTVAHKSAPWNTISYGAKGAVILAGSSDGTVDFIETKSHTVATSWPFHSFAVNAAQLSPDNKHLLTAGDDGKTSLYNIELDSVLLDQKTGIPVLCASFSPDGKYFMTGDWSAKATYWETGKSTPVYTLQHQGATQVLSIAFSPRSPLAATTTDKGTIFLWDLINGKLKRVLKGHQAAIYMARFSPDGQRLLSVSLDHRSAVWDVESGKMLYSFFRVGTSDYIVELPNHYYYASPGTAKFLHYVTPELQPISFDQLDVKYNRPDLVLQQLGSSDTALQASYRKAYEKRVKKLGIDTAAFGDAFGIPEAMIKNRLTMNAEQRNEWIKLDLQVRDSAVLLDRFHVWVNGVPLHGMQGVSLRKRNLQVFDTLISLRLSPGINQIEVSVLNRNGTESYRTPLRVKYIPAAPVEERLHFIGIGIDRFKDSRHNLAYSVKDIRDLAVFLRLKSPTIQIDTLFDENVTIANVLALKRKLLRTQVSDKVIIAYSGHGLLSKEYDYFLSTFPVDFQKPELDGLSYEALESLLDSIPARRKLLLLDACHSGEVDKDEMVRIQSFKNGTGVQTKGGEVLNADTSALGMTNSFEIMRQLFVNVGRSTGATVIAAAGGTQFAQERGTLKNGVFTFSLLEFMKQSSDVSINALKNYVDKRVPELTGGLQQPTSRAENFSDDWKLWSQKP